jgi:hypothetical protein
MAFGDSSAVPFLAPAVVDLFSFPERPEMHRCSASRSSSQLGMTRCVQRSALLRRSREFFRVEIETVAARAA